MKDILLNCSSPAVLHTAETTEHIPTLGCRTKKQEFSTNKKPYRNWVGWDEMGGGGKEGWGTGGLFTMWEDTWSHCLAREKSRSRLFSYPQIFPVCLLSSYRRCPGHCYRNNFCFSVNKV
jgi:hypothetical protein